MFEINPDNFAVNDIVGCRAYPYPDPDEGNVSLNDDDTYCCDGNCTSVLEAPCLQSGSDVIQNTEPQYT